ncbi:hypothetical protein WA158_000984 [Blastocystis sp. Blastoise]
MEFENSFFEACMNGNSDRVIHEIEDNHFYINSRDEDKRTGLHWAASSNNNELVSYLISQKGIEIDALDEMGWSPLFCAISCGKYENAVTLIEAGANPNIVDENNKCLLHYIKGNYKLAELLCDNMKNINIKGDYGITPLMRACSYGNLKTIQLLVDKGASIDDCDEMGNTPLHYAAMDQQTEIYDYLVSKGADETIQNSEKYTPKQML